MRPEANMISPTPDSEFEADLQDMAHRQASRLGSRWEDVLAVGRHIGVLPLRHPVRLERMYAAVELARTTRRTIEQYSRLYAVLIAGWPGAPEPVIPEGIDYSTALHLVQHGADRAFLFWASEEGWTLRDARAWAQNRGRVGEPRNQRLWSYVTKTVRRKLRTLDMPPNDMQRAEIVQSVRRALEEYGGTGIV